MKRLVVYFSRTGQNSVDGDIEVINKGFTEILAEKIANYTGAEIFKLVPEVPYPDDYEECVKRSKIEDEQNLAVPFLNKMDNLDEYDTIYLGFPCWWRTYPRIVATFLRTYSFKNKTIYPFTTNEEGAMGLSELELASAVKDANIKQGFSCKGSQVNNIDEKLKLWLMK